MNTRSNFVPNAIRFRIDPRDVPPIKAARLLGVTLDEFEAALPRLRARAFPPPDPDTGNYDMKAIETWMDRRSGLAVQEDAQDAAFGFNDRLGALRGQSKRRADR